MNNDLGMGDFEAFMNAVDDKVMDRWLLQSFGHQAEETLVLDDFTVVEAVLLHDAVVTFIEEAQDDGDMLRFALGWRLRRKLAESDERIDEWSSERHEPQNLDELLAAMFGGRR